MMNQVTVRGEKKSQKVRILGKKFSELCLLQFPVQRVQLLLILTDENCF